MNVNGRKKIIALNYIFTYMYCKIHAQAVDNNKKMRKVTTCPRNSNYLALGQYNVRILFA